MATDEKNMAAVQHENIEKIGDVNAVQTVHTDGAVDYVDSRAIGGDLDSMPPGYFYSFQFIGTVTVSATRSLYLSLLASGYLLILRRPFAVLVFVHT